MPRKVHKKTPREKERFLAALERSLGNVSVAAEKSGISRANHYRWMQEDEEYKAKVIELEEVTLDFAESQLMKQIRSGNTTATIFFLKTKGKSRDYIERSEVKQEITSQPPTIVKIEGRNVIKPDGDDEKE